MYHKAIAELSKDENLRALIKTIGPIEFKPKRIDPYKSIIRAIIYQQLTGKAAGTIFDRFLKLAPTTAFPKPEFILELSEQSLRSAGLSGSKVRYIKAVAKMTASGDLPPLKKFDKMNDLEIINCLTATHGVGRWTAEMFLISNMGRLDVFPVNDLGVRKGFQVVFNKRKLPEPEALMKFSKRWSPYRTFVTLYFWRAADMLKVAKV